MNDTAAVSPGAPEGDAPAATSARTRRRLLAYLALCVLVALVALAGNYYMRTVRSELSNEFDASSLPAMPTDGSGPTAMGASGAGGGGGGRRSAPPPPGPAPAAAPR